jgi:glycerol-3-phosphate cytidylyltransferase-like family protein
MRELWIADIVHVWDTTNPLKWLELYHPKVVCLWYDQVWFSEALKNHIKQRKLNVKVIRIDPYKELKYKSSLIKDN